MRGDREMLLKHSEMHPSSDTFLGMHSQLLFCLHIFWHPLSSSSYSSLYKFTWGWDAILFLYLLFLSQGHQTGVTFVPHLCLGLELCFILSWIPPFPLHWSTAGDLLSLHSGTCLVLPHKPPANISGALVFSRPAQAALIYSKFP